MAIKGGRKRQRSRETIYSPAGRNIQEFKDGGKGRDKEREREKRDAKSVAPEDNIAAERVEWEKEIETPMKMKNLIVHLTAFDSPVTSLLFAEFPHKTSSESNKMYDALSAKNWPSPGSLSPRALLEVYCVPFADRDIARDA